MANYESNQMLVAVKAYTRGNPLSLDASETWESLAEASTYAASAIAYPGQTIKAKLEDGKYHTYVLQPSEAGYTLEEVGINSEYKQYVIIGTRPGSGQEEGIIYIENNVGYIWNGTGWIKVFEDFSTDITALDTRVDTVETSLDSKAPLDSPAFINTVTIDGNSVATQDWVNTLIGQINNGVPGVVDTTEHPLPSTDYKAGQMWRVAADGTFADNVCEIGDLILCLKDYSEDSAENSDFMVIQANIDGAVTGADASTDGHLVVWNGSTGKVIKDSEISIMSLNDALSKVHEHTNKTQLDSYTKTQSELLSDAHDDAVSQIAALQGTITEALEAKADTSNVYTRTDIDSKLSTITTNLNTKIDAATVDSKITAAKDEILGDIDTNITDSIDTKIGDLGESETVVEYVSKVVGSGGTDVAEQIDEALTQAKAYTDAAITITEF